LYKRLSSSVYSLSGGAVPGRATHHPRNGSWGARPQTPSPPRSRTDWTRLVPRPILAGHVSSLPRTSWTRLVPPPVLAGHVSSPEEWHEPELAHLQHHDRRQDLRSPEVWRQRPALPGGEVCTGPGGGRDVRPVCRRGEGMCVRYVREGERCASGLYRPRGWRSRRQAARRARGNALERTPRTRGSRLRWRRAPPGGRAHSGRATLHTYTHTYTGVCKVARHVTAGVCARHARCGCRLSSAWSAPRRDASCGAGACVRAPRTRRVRLVRGEGQDVSG